ncbi:MAG: tRNA guanosine(15) transglycosylase TgtA [Candidatus Bathyarchaeota archaeon]|nr:MAG: tRNA guanosine(15) transglycosylase TgtA [Candidatus Bathyarchaeota archaeon]
MSFEIRDRDLLARIGKFETKRGIIETPLLLPVINPNVQLIPPRILQEEFGCRALITNAYILKTHFEDEIIEQGLHDFLDFNGVFMTDSGAYQILVYGDVEVTSEEIVRFQEEIDTDIATILDVPTSWTTSKQQAQRTVNETMRKARELAKIKTRDDIAWVGPVQGGQYLDLVAQSASEIGKLPFQIHALGSPTPIMEQYLFDVLVDMILTAKKNLPLERPLHLFGAGHPFMFALAIALGCDLFDSAAYALYAREERYMTEYGTTRFDKLEYFPCSCPLCNKNDPQSVAAMPKIERQKLLAQHNLYTSFSELRRIKQAIMEGRLWEHLELRAHGHPALLKAVKHLKKHSGYLEKQSPVTKKSGLFFFSSLGLTRPEVVRHRERLLERYLPPKEAEVLVLLPQTRKKPFSKSWEHRRALKYIQQNLGDKMGKVHVCTYAAPFGVIPRELEEVYPLSQYELATPLDAEMIEYVAKRISEYIITMNYKKVALLRNIEMWKGKIATACRRACKKKKISFTMLSVDQSWNERMLKDFAAVIQKTLS